VSAQARYTRNMISFRASNRHKIVFEASYIPFVT
jgi:hypothetical protein